jgi:FkbM family methyltransferase
MTNRIIKLLNILRNRFFLSALFKGTAAGTEHFRMLNNLDCNHIIDIGANKGQFALVARKKFPKARIDSFEPLSEAADIFEKVFKNENNTFLHRIAIGRKEESHTIHVSNKDDSSSLLPIGENQISLFPGTQELEQRLIKVAPLESIIARNDIQQPAMLKIDVQGYELEVLYGCQSLFDKISYIYCECSFFELYEGQALTHEIIDFLNQNGFKLSGIYHVHYNKSGIAIQADFLFSS